MAALLDFALFAGKAFILVLAALALAAGLAALARRGRESGHLEVRPLDRHLRKMEYTLRHALFGRAQFRAQLKAQRKADKSRLKNDGPRVFVLGFEGDLRATRVDQLREEITALLTLADPARDRVVVRVESGGGLVHGYGLAAAQLARVRERGIPLTVTVDKIAASGGYMMAAVADRIVAAPFAVVGSIGVVAQIPNVHRLLKRNDVDVELLTAGQYKRTLTVFGENTDEGRAKFQEELETAHALFQRFLQRYRPQLDLERLATGEHWFGEEALELQLVDELGTSDDLLLQLAAEARVFELRFVRRQPMGKRLTLAFESAVERWLGTTSRP